MIRPITNKQYLNRLATHPLQSFDWGEFRQKTGVKVVRQGLWQDGQLVRAWQMTIHKISPTNWTIGYLPKGPMWNKEMLASLVKVAKENNCIFIKMEPNVQISQKSKVKSQKFNDFHLRKSPHPLFSGYTLQIDLEKSQDELIKSFKPKTRYNIRLAQRKGVVVTEEKSQEAFEIYLKLLKETSRRDKFYAHNENYHRLLWKTLKSAGMAHLLMARFKTMPLAAWVLFKFKKTLYYPYGASSSAHRDLMASNLLLWEAIKLGKKLGCQVFDLWGSLGPHPNPKDPWFGFHRFKLGYNPKLVEFIGSYDLILKPQLYYFYNLSHRLRWLMLK